MLEIKPPRLPRELNLLLAFCRASMDQDLDRRVYPVKYPRGISLHREISQRDHGSGFNWGAAHFTGVYPVKYPAGISATHFTGVYPVKYPAGISATHFTGVKTSTSGQLNWKAFAVELGDLKASLPVTI